MHDFILKEVKPQYAKVELENIGFDKSYIERATDKFQYRNIKIFNLTVAQANILKQTALSVGADCATHRDTITAKVEFSDCILSGSISQIEKISKKLEMQPFGLKQLAKELNNFVINKNKTKIVGILNLTQDSFSDGYSNFDDAIEHYEEIKQADIIELGAESTKPNSKPISDEKQLEKLIPMINYLKKSSIVISIDTRSSKVAEECLKSGADIINDVSGFDYDENMPEIIAKYNAKVVIQHSNGTPENFQTEYNNLTDDIYLSLKNKINLALSKGIDKKNIIVDVGIGFGKTREQNFELINRIEEFYGLGCPVMVGVSRKSLLDMQDEDNFTKDIYTLALNSLLIDKKVDYIRVHNVKLHKKLLEILSM